MMDAIGELLARVFGAFPLRSVALMLAALVLAGGTGFLAATALGVGSQEPRTVTIDVATGPTGPEGPAGPTGPRGPSGTSACPAGFGAGKLVINHPGGQVAIWTCLED